MYIDPGAGSVVFQAILAAVLGAGILAKLFWNKIRLWLGYKPAADKHSKETI
jgi:hypothetical protein